MRRPLDVLAGVAPKAGDIATNRTSESADRRMEAASHVVTDHDEPTPTP